MMQHIINDSPFFSQKEYYNKVPKPSLFKSLQAVYSFTKAAEEKSPFIRDKTALGSI